MFDRLLDMYFKRDHQELMASILISMFYKLL